MGAAQTTGDRWKHPTEKEQRGWRRAQTNSKMIQQLSKDVDAQYHCYQPYLLLTDIMSLYRTCHMWSYWIRSPGSVVHRSQLHAQSRARNPARIVSILNSADLLHLSRSQWIQGYLYGCRIQPSIDERPNHWLNSSLFKLQLNLKPLAELKQIQHLTLDHVPPNELTTERIQTYFTALSPNLRSLDLFPTLLSNATALRVYPRSTNSTILNGCLHEIHLLANLDELRLTSRCSFGLLYLRQLPKLSHLHTFICTNHQPYDQSQSVLELGHLAACKQLQHCSWGRYAPGRMGALAGARDAKSFLRARAHVFRESDHPLSASSSSSSSGAMVPVVADPMEYVDFSTILMDSELWTLLSTTLPNLKTLKALWQLSPGDWSLLPTFKQLTHLSIVMGEQKIEVNDFFTDLVQCRTIQALILGDMTSPLTEHHLWSILSNLKELTDLTLSAMILDSVACFSTPNQLRRLVFNYCRGNQIKFMHGCLHRYPTPLVPGIPAFNIRAALPSIPTLTHLTLLEPNIIHQSIDSLEQVTYAKELFSRMPLLRSGQFVEKTYHRVEIESKI